MKSCKNCICNECRHKEDCSDNHCESCQYGDNKFAIYDNFSDDCYGYEQATECR
jgi:hypothetical protein